jgi:multiple sugar transport system substrate-binding protein
VAPPRETGWLRHGSEDIVWRGWCVSIYPPELASEEGAVSETIPHLDRHRTTSRHTVIQGTTRRALWRGVMGAGVALGGMGVTACAARGTTGTEGPGEDGRRKTLAPAKITFFTHWGAQHHVDGQQQTLAAFQEENPGLTVEMVTGGSAADKIITAITGGTPPDMVTQSAGRLLPLALRSTWRPLEDLLKASTVVKREHYSDVQLKLFTWKGKLYGIPAFEHSGLPALAYNVAHFQEVGLDPQAPPRRPDELYRAHERLTVVQGGAIKRLGLDPRDASGGGYGTWAAQWNAPWWNPDTMALELNTPAAVEAHTYILSYYRPQERAAQIAEFRKEYLMWTQARSGITLSTQSMQLNGYFAPGELKVLPEKPAAMGYSWFPNPKGEKVAIAQGWSGCIPAASKLPEHGWRLLEFFASTRGGQIMFDTIGWLNGSRQFLKEGKFDAVPDLKFYLEMPAKADRHEGGYATPIQSDLDAEYNKGMTAVIEGQLSVRAMLDDLQARMKPLLEQTLASAG